MKKNLQKVLVFGRELAFFMLILNAYSAFAFQEQLNENIVVFNSEFDMNCGTFRTQTQGGWGSPANGNNPGVYRDLHFDNAFPNGLSIGCDYTLTLSSAEAVQDFLPSGGTASALTEDLTDPTSYNNVLAGQLVALTLSVGFDENDQNFSDSDILLGNLIINSGTFESFTVYELLDEANLFFGACTSSYNASQLNEALSAINENFVDGTIDNGFLDCPEEEVEEVLCSLNLVGVNSFCNGDDSYTVEFSISGYNGSYVIEDPNALSGSGQYICLGDSADTEALHEYTYVLTYSMESTYAPSIYAIIPSIDNCVEATNSDACILNDISGIAPNCCDLSLTCPTNTQFVYSCLEDILPIDPSSFTYENNCGPISITFEDETNGSGCVSAPLYLTRTYYITDGVTTLNCVYNYIVIDNMPPTISCPSSDTAVCSTDEIVPVNWASAIDNCDADVEITYQNVLEESCSSFNRIWTATDNCGNTATCTQTVYITDATAPNLIAPDNITVNCGSITTPAVTGNAIASDACSNVSISYTDSEIDGNSCSSSFIRTWTATDACGNVSSQEQIINIEDVTPPVIIDAPGNLYIQCGEIPTAQNLVAYDQCQNDSIECVLTEAIYGEGCGITVFRTWTATDLCGNTSSRTHFIRLSDTEAPIITCPENIVLNCGDPVPDTSEAGVASAYDNCSEDSVTISYIDVNIPNACPPKVNRIWSAADTCGNVSTCIQEISFLDTSAPDITCVDDITINCSMGNTLPLFTGTPSAIDDCSEVTLNYSDGDISGDCPYSFVRTWTATDACSNSTSCEQIITVIDELAPTIYCPADASISCGSSASPSVTGMASAYDNCSSFTIDYSDSDSSGTCPITFTRTWTVTDYCGNTSSCEQLISIIDNTAPVITCPETIDLACGTTDISVDITGTPDVYDACSDFTLTHYDSPIQGACPQYFYRIWTAIDACENTSQCYQLINLVDEVAPELVCPDDLTINCNDDVSPDGTGWATATDDCSSLEISYNDSIIENESINGENNCGGFRTQTQGGWGSRAHGNNPGFYRDQHFDQAFPDGLQIGCDVNLTFYSSEAIQNFLPSGGTPSALTNSMVNPVGYGNTLAGQLVALGLSLGFDEFDPEFSESSSALSDLYIAYGIFSGWTVGEIYAEANRFIGQCESNYSASQLNDVLSRINENYVDGTHDNSFLICDGDIEVCSSIYRTWIATDACGNTSTCEQLITLSNENYNVPIPLADMAVSEMKVYPSPTSGEITILTKEEIMEGDILEVFDLSGITVLSKRMTSGLNSIDLGDLSDGIYIISWTNKNGTLSQRIIKND